MAKSYPSLDHTSWSCLPAPSSSCWPQGAAAWFSTAAATFENDALASALVRASMPPSSPTPSTSTTTSSASELSSFISHDAPLTTGTPVAASGARRPQARCLTGRVTKRKPRPSRRAPVTYITADPADFSRMVQEITGLQSPGGGRVESAAAPPCSAQAALAFVLPTLDTSASFLVDRAPAPAQPEEDSTSWCRAAASSSEEDWSLALMQELEPTVCAPPAVASSFPTLDSWGRGMI